MKQLYISPELEILCFAPAENLASNFGFDTGPGAVPFALKSDAINPSIVESRPGDYEEDNETVEPMG